LQSNNRLLFLAKDKYKQKFFYVLEFDITFPLTQSTEYEMFICFKNINFKILYELDIELQTNQKQCFIFGF
jgi:hypothetical protein